MPSIPNHLLIYEFPNCSSELVMRLYLHCTFSDVLFMCYSDISSGKIQMHADTCYVHNNAQIADTEATDVDMHLLLPFEDKISTLTNTRYI